MNFRRSLDGVVDSISVYFAPEMIAPAFGTRAHLDDVDARSACAAVGLSERSLRRLFLAHAGLSFSEYLQKARVLRAMSLLTSSDRSILDIALAVGFESPSGFHRAFKQLCGVSPAAYPKRGRGGRRLTEGRARGDGSGPGVLFRSSVPELDPRQLESLQTLVEAWAKLWRVPDLAKSVGIRVSTRLRRSLGSYRASRQQITLAAWLLDEGVRALLEEVLCHEAAHAAVHLSGGRRVRPHGAEWRAFMREAGRVPRVRIPTSLIPEVQRARFVVGKVWEHRCPVCRVMRMARTRVTRWRCRRCVEAGRGGRLTIERVGVGVGVDA